MKQRGNIKFCFELGKQPIETYDMLQNVCGDEASSRSSVYKLFKQFKDGCEDLQGGSSSGRTSTSRNADTIANVCEMVT
jgi:hypothetical protein